MSDTLLDKRYFDNAFSIRTNYLDDNIDSNTGLFEQLCSKKIKKLNFEPSELVEQNKFITIVDRINIRYPFLVFPIFIQDLMSGWYSATILEKYHLRNFLELHYIVENILKIKGKRIKGVRPNTLELNLKNLKCKQTYDLIIKNSLIFKDELEEILNKNLLRAFIILHLFEKIEGVTKIEISENIFNIVEKHKSRINIFSDKPILISFYKYVKSDLDDVIDSIFQELLNKEFIKQRFSPNQVFFLNQKCTNIKETILKILEQHPDGLPHDRFHRALLRTIPLLKLIPKVGLWESAIAKLENSKVKRIEAYWRYRPYRDQLFTQENFDKKIKEMKKQVVAAGTTKFFGRQIEPNEFILELEKLEKGDLDDVDDQVTRLAGLVLAGSILLQTPHESLDEFDFAVDVSNFEFSSEQREAMQRVDFAVTSKILHCKVMISETVESNLLEKIKQILPSDQQAVIFTLNEISESVKNLLPSDKSIQIVGKEGILSWTSITPVIPCRVGSIAKVMYGDHRGKIVRIDTVNYESGLANISVLANKNDFSVYVGALQEKWFGEFDPVNYYAALENYNEFLLFLLENSLNSESFEKALFELNIQSAQYTEYLPHTDKVIKSDDIDVKKEEKYLPLCDGLPSQNNRIIEWKIKVSDVETKIVYQKNGDLISFDRLSIQSSELDPATDKIRDFLKCECTFFNEQQHSTKFCPHIVVALDFIAKKLNQFDRSWNDTNDNIIKKLLLTFQKLKKFSIIDYVSGWCSDEEFDNLIKFIKNLPKNDDNQSEKQSLIPQKVLEELRIEIISQFDSSDFNKALSKMESTITSMTKDEVLEVIDVLEHGHMDSIRRRKNI